MWYASGLEFECAGCGDCCRGDPGYVWVRRSDIAGIAELLEKPRDYVMQRYTRRIGSRYSLKELKNLDCIFWDNGCEIYSARPPQCKSFPFWKEHLKNPARWEALSEQCPGINSKTLHQVPGMGTEHAFAELEKLYQKAEEELNALGASCRACGECCHFKKSGHELFATTLEVCYLVGRTGMPAGAVTDDVCPYLEEERCSARDHRTLACRVFFCGKKLESSFASIYEKYRKEIGKVCSAYSLPIKYARMTDIMGDMYNGQ